MLEHVSRKKLISFFLTNVKICAQSFLNNSYFNSLNHLKHVGALVVLNESFKLFK